MTEDEDPLTPEQREGVNRALEVLVETDRAFVCGICRGYVAAGFEVAHAEWHEASG
jgi:hypothetical protein